MSNKGKGLGLNKIADEIVEGFEVNATTSKQEVDDLFDWVEIQEKYKLDNLDLEKLKFKVAFLIEVMIQENDL